MKLSPGVFTICLLLAVSCQRDQPDLILPLNFNIGQSVPIKAAGLNPGELYSISAQKHDIIGRIWLAEARYIANAEGEIDVSLAAPDSGSYTGVDPDGLFWSMGVDSSMSGSSQSKDYALIHFSLIKNRDTLARSSTRQWIIPTTVEKDLIQGTLEAEVYWPAEISGKKPGILLLGGSGGGLSWAKRVGAILANEGYVCMALAYFNQGDLPQHLAQLPLEYVFQAIDQLKNREDVDSLKLGILGYSKGAELGLLTASLRQDIKAVAAIAPGAAVFQGFKPPRYPVLSSWTYQNKELDFVPNAYDKKFFETFDGMYLWYKTLAQHEAMNNAGIPVEKINGPILLLSGVDDQIWPSTFMAELLVARLHIAEFPFSYEHLAFPKAGHGIAEPPGHPTIQLGKRLGGTGPGNHQARKEVWSNLKAFFSNALK